MRRLSLRLPSGTFLGIVGASGCGKTTLLKCIFGELDVNEGEIFFQEERVYGPSRNLIPGHPEMQLVSQDFQVLENHTVAENLRDKLNGYTEVFKEKKVNQMLRLLRLKDLEGMKAAFLSSGQRQRLSIGRALIRFPKLLLLDEPLSNLDTMMRNEIFLFIRQQLQLHQSSCIMVTHHPEEVMPWCDKVALMTSHRLGKALSPEQAYFHPTQILLSQMLGKSYVLPSNEIPGLKEERKKIILRPEQILPKACTPRALKISVTIEAVLFSSGRWEVLARTAKGSQIGFYLPYYDKPLAGSEMDVFIHT